MTNSMSERKKQDIFHDPWPKAHRNGKKELLKAIKEMSHAGFFEVDESGRVRDFRDNNGKE